VAFGFAVASEAAPFVVMVDASGEGADIDIASGGADEFGSADASSAPTEAPLFTPAEPVVMNTGALGTAGPLLSTPVGRAASSARALAGERDAGAFLDDAFAVGGVRAETDGEGINCEDVDCDEIERGEADCAARSACSRKIQQRRLVPCSRR